MNLPFGMVLLLAVVFARMTLRPRWQVLGWLGCMTCTVSLLLLGLVQRMEHAAVVAALLLIGAAALAERGTKG